MLVITNTATMNTAATLSGAASNAIWISRDSVIATWFKNWASPKAATTITTVSHTRRFRTASRRVVLASEATIGIGREIRPGCRFIKAGTIRAYARVSPGGR